MREEGGEVKAVSLCRPDLSFEFPTHGYLNPWRHFASISVYITKEPANMLSENLVGVSVWGCEQHLGWEVEGGTSSGPV